MADNEFGGPDFSAAELAAGSEWLAEDGNLFVPEFGKPELPEFDIEAWKAEGRALGERHKELRWAIGDWLIKGEPHIPEIDGETIAGYYMPAMDVYTEGQAVTGLARATLKDLASTARRCPSSVRTDALTWSHHRTAVNELPKADEATFKRWLERAVEDNLSVSELKEQIRAEAWPKPKPVTEKSIVVTIPADVWQTLKDIADDEKITVQELAAQFLAGFAESEEGITKREIAKRQTQERRSQAKRKQGKKLARLYPLRENK
jgi:hypothetical protein